MHVQSVNLWLRNIADGDVDVVDHTLDDETVVVTIDTDNGGTVRAALDWASLERLSFVLSEAVAERELKRMGVA